MLAAQVCRWDQPSEPLGPGLACGTTLCDPELSPGIHGSPYGAFNLAQHVGDNPEAVTKNRGQLASSLGVRAIQWLDQVHGVEVIEASHQSASSAPQADAVWTATPGLAVAVLTADCLPVVVAARDGTCIGVAHGGWRGLVQGVLPALVAAMPVPASQLLAWGGPGIGLANYEVGTEVAEAVNRIPGADAALLPGVMPGKFQLDLHGLARLSLAQAGVMRYQATGRCAFADPACYSYRRVRGGATGRMATLGLLLG